MTILLLGATGRTGYLVAKKLHAASIPFRALIRNAAKSEAFRQLGATPVMGDLSADLTQAFQGAHAIVYAAGSAETEGEEQERQIDRDAVIRCVDYAKQAGADRFIVISALLAYEPEHAPQALRHYAQMKRESDDYVVGSGLDYVVLRPGVLTMEPGVGTIAIVSDATSPREPVTREDVAEVTLDVLRAGIVNKVIGFAGGAVPISDALAKL